MGGYRSLKRVLGESNLERKCRWLFGVCVGGLIFLAFLSVGLIAQNLLDDAARDKGRNAAFVAVFDIHWRIFNNSPDPSQEDLQQELTRQMNREFIDPRFMTLESGAGPLRTRKPLYSPADDRERELLERLKVKADQRLLESPPPAAPASPAGPDIAASILQMQSMTPVAEAYLSPSDGRYYYYQVVEWSAICKSCHEGMPGFTQSIASDAGNVASDTGGPFRAIRVTMPGDEMRTAIHRTQAILWTVGFLTVFLAMVALYYVVKYIVIKPLAHLREVSDEVARGNLDQRADIHTNDEFEDLAASFNKMLAHLVETQGELRKANTQLDHKVDELAHVNMQLHEMNRVKGEFLANMSHELRTPLNSVIGFSEVLQSLDALNDKQKRYAQNIQKAGRQLLEMINDILDLAKMEAGKMEVRLSEFRLENVIAEQCEMVRDMADEKNIDLRVEIASELPLLYQDQTKVQQILTNLLSNAIKFTPEGGRIMVGAASDAQGQIAFWVADTGVGIPPSEKEIIFEKFRQGKAVLGRDNLTREYSGTGLGLSIVKELCKLLGGEVGVESELGKGSIFRVVVPWMRTDTAAATAKLTARLDEIARPRRLDNLRGEPATEVVAAAAGPN